jgi:glycosyltransferase involved in cell wall biosynthesis
VSANDAVPSAIIGGGVDLAAGWEQAAARFQLPPSYLLYVGRIDRGKGVDRLFDHYLQLASDWPDVPPLVLAGKKHLDVPSHPKIRHLGEVTDAEKFALIDGCDLLLLPSPYESLSIAVLEAWSLARPVLVNGACRVLAGQCLRSNGGLFYEGYAELEPMLRLMFARPGLRAAMGRAGQEYVRREYAWDVVESRTDALLTSLRR